MCTMVLNCCNSSKSCRIDIRLKRILSVVHVESKSKIRIRFLKKGNRYCMQTVMWGLNKFNSRKELLEQTFLQSSYHFSFLPFVADWNVIFSWTSREEKRPSRWYDHDSWSKFNATMLEVPPMNRPPRFVPLISAFLNLWSWIRFQVSKCFVFGECFSDTNDRVEH